MFTLSKSAPDSNRFYSILLDTQASKTSENMYDTAEKLLLGEKTNAKSALEHLWALKKNLHNQDEVSTIDLLIQYYQTKIDVLRTKEEHIKKISKDSRGLLEDKRKRDAEVATIKQEIADCSSEIKELSAKLEKLKIKEQELTLIESQLKKELVVNDNEIVNGLYEIIIASSGGMQPGAELSQQLGADEALEAQKSAVIESENEISPPENARPTSQNAPGAAPAMTSDHKTDSPDLLDDADYPTADKIDKDETDYVLYKKVEPQQPPPYPKSVVKTTRGRVVGEYYYDPATDKNKRVYIFNGAFFLEQLSHSLSALKIAPNEIVHAEMLQMIQDAYKRISENPAMRFEISTNGLLNEKTLKELWHNVKVKNYREAERFCKRLGAKLTALGGNYRAILEEQMKRCLES
jgi:hypothetical protein